MNETLIRRLVLEVRNCSGVEKTPEQMTRIVHGRFRRPETAVRRLIADPDLCQQFAAELKLPGSDDLPNTEQILQG